MPKSKRAKITHTTKRQSMKIKVDLVSQIRKCVDTYSSIYLFSVETMRNNLMKRVRNEWKNSRFFYGKNKVIMVAFGRTESEQYKQNLYQLSKRLKGDVGVFFTNEPKDEVMKWFEQHRYPDFARAGNIATYDISLEEGPLDSEVFNHSMEPQMRQLGLPTALQKGIIHLTTSYSVCKQGDTLTPEQCRILKMFGYTLADFRIVLRFIWTSDGEIEELN